MKNQPVGNGERCRRCSQIMLRFRHKDGWNPKVNQPYYFSYWDKCRCGMIQHYEKAKIFLAAPEKDELTEEFKAIMGGRIEL
jgi:hypothetical protein